MAQNNSRVFLDRGRAKAFAEYLGTQHAEDVEVWVDTDAFGQAQYIVRWNAW